MTDAHCHSPTGNSRHFICDPTFSTPAQGDITFYGYHPWAFLPGAETLPGDWLDELRERLISSPRSGVGEIGLDRLKEKRVPEAMRRAFSSQLDLAIELGRPVVLHGAKCWGEVVAEVKNALGRIVPPRPVAFLFHSFSRSGGLLGDIASLNGFVSVGGAVLNDHAVNYRKLVAAVPDRLLLLETDGSGEGERPSLGAIARAVASLRGVSPEYLISLHESNSARFLTHLWKKSPALPCYPNLI